RLGDLRLFAEEIQGLGFEVDASRLLLQSLADYKIHGTRPPFDHVFLFTGHMIDSATREHPRFPAKNEHAAAKAIADAVASEAASLQKQNKSILGITGGACGGDILFHEACHAAGISSHMYLLFPRKKFLDASVSFAGQSWVDRFDKIYDRLTPDERPVLGENDELPTWLKEKNDYSIWVRNNLWMLNNALVYGGANVTLFALWNGEGGDGVGGTQDMVDQASAEGAKPVILNTKNLFDLV
ncbi:MAG: hypothetical protein AAF564_23790, partial [Bacteroidota bacterium]